MMTVRIRQDGKPDTVMENIINIRSDAGRTVFRKKLNDPGTVFPLPEISGFSAAMSDAWVVIRFSEPGRPGSVMEGVEEFHYTSTPEQIVTDGWEGKHTFYDNEVSGFEISAAGTAGIAVRGTHPEREPEEKFFTFLAAAMREKENLDRNGYSTVLEPT